MDERYDAVVVGAGVAGLRAAIELADTGLSVAVVAKDPSDQSSSGQAQGGIAVVLSGEEEDIVLHEDDTLRAGAGLCDAPAVSVLVRDGREEVLRLIAWGARFDREGDRYHLTREAAHSMPRILHAGGDATGREIVRTLVSQVRTRAGAVRVPGIATDLLTDGEGIAGVRVVSADGSVRRLLAGAVLLATGGIGCCWTRTSNPPEATGDGLALALRAGCVLGDMEFVQFHPTALAREGAPAWLLTEALRGEGGVIRDLSGRRFLLDDDERGELAPRDVVARGIARKIREQSGRPVLLDVTGLSPEFVQKRFPGIVAGCRRWGIDPLTEPIPVAPAAHYAMGGIVTDVDGRTSVPGLAAAGEAAETGVHGANRLASNSLLEGLVFGARAARALIADGRTSSRSASPEDPVPSVYTGDDAVAARAALTALAEERLGILREGDELARVLDRLEEACEMLGEPRRPVTRDVVEAASTALVLRAVARAAEWRTESRGAHYRAEWPHTDDIHLRCHSRQTLSGLLPPEDVET